MDLTKAADAGRAAVGDTGQCQVCHESVPLKKDGLPKVHKWRVLHNPGAAPEHQVVTESPCLGSRLPPVEFAVAFEAARKSKTVE